MLKNDQQETKLTERCCKISSMSFILTGNSLNDNDDDSVSSLVIDTNSNVDKEKAHIEAIFVSSVTTKLRS